jgi:hypothetical protein
MKSQLPVRSQAVQADAYAAPDRIIEKRYKKIKKQHTTPPPDEESCSRLNAIAREYPFCIYYREKNNDPL